MTEQTTTGVMSPDEPEGPQEPARGDAAPKDRRKLFAGLRWTAAVLVFAVAGAGTAYGIVRQQRTDLPGLSTRSDGRWAYPAQALPALPAGAPLPGGADNEGAVHYADLGTLLLTPPTGARSDAGFKADKDGIVSSDAFLEEYRAEDRTKLKESLDWDGLRRIAGRAWITPDGTRTRIYLLRFHSSSFTDAFQGCRPDVRLSGAATLALDAQWDKLGGEGNTNTASNGSDFEVYEEPKPFGEEQTRFGCLQAGDVQAVIIQSRKGGAAMVPFHQTVVLQSRLLG
ncbi:hypothetical protein [Streptomyces sp. A1136]|uniref:hypothetical protein n=1 Tax=Streptomyces sp. A1136 TaxID=2563102 RepID=UPI001F0FE568|nr:hypothetical protein [Streptomyces sp. A1136]